MFREILEMISEPIKLVEALSKKELELMRLQYAYPDMRPCTFDVTVESWLDRIGTWGKLTFTYKDPESNKKSNVTFGQFIKRFGEPNLLQLLGKWEFKGVKQNRVTCTRTYLNAAGKKVTEEFTIDCKIKV